MTIGSVLIIAVSGPYTLCQFSANSFKLIIILLPSTSLESGFIAITSTVDTMFSRLYTSGVRRSSSLDSPLRDSS